MEEKNRNPADSNKWTSQVGPVSCGSPDYKSIPASVDCQIGEEVISLPELLKEIEHYRSIRFLVIERAIYNDYQPGLRACRGAFHTRQSAEVFVEQLTTNKYADCYEYYIVDLKRVAPGIWDMDQPRRYIGEEA